MTIRGGDVAGRNNRPPLLYEPLHVSHGFAVRSAIVSVMLLVALYSGLVVLREVDSIQRAAGVLPSTLPAGDARRVRFDALHQLSTRLMVVNIVGALALLGWEAREH